MLNILKKNIICVELTVDYIKILKNGEIIEPSQKLKSFFPCKTNGSFGNRVVETFTDLEFLNNVFKEVYLLTKTISLNRSILLISIPKEITECEILLRCVEGLILSSGFKEIYTINNFTCAFDGIGLPVELSNGLLEKYFVIYSTSTTTYFGVYLGGEFFNTKILPKSYNTVTIEELCNITSEFLQGSLELTDKIKKYKKNETLIKDSWIRDFSKNIVVIFPEDEFNTLNFEIPGYSIYLAKNYNSYVMDSLKKLSLVLPKMKKNLSDSNVTQPLI